MNSDPIEEGTTVWKKYDLFAGSPNGFEGRNLADMAGGYWYEWRQGKWRRQCDFDFATHGGTINIKALNRAEARAKFGRDGEEGEWMHESTGGSYQWHCGKWRRWVGLAGPGGLWKWFWEDTLVGGFLGFTLVVGFLLPFLFMLLCFLLTGRM